MLTIRYRRVKSGLTLNKLLQKVYQRLSLALGSQKNILKTEENRMLRIIFFSNLKFGSFTDGACQQDGASLHLHVRAFMTYGTPTAKNATKGFIFDLGSNRCLISHTENQLLYEHC